MGLCVWAERANPIKSTLGKRREKKRLEFRQVLVARCGQAHIGYIQAGYIFLLPFSGTEIAPNLQFQNALESGQNKVGQIPGVAKMQIMPRAKCSTGYFFPRNTLFLYILLFPLGICKDMVTHGKRISVPIYQERAVLNCY